MCNKEIRKKNLDRFMCPTLERVVKARVLCALCGETIWRVESHRRLLDVKRKKRILYAKVLEWNGEGKTHLAAITRPRKFGNYHRSPMRC